MSTTSTEKDTRTGVKVQPARPDADRAERPDEARPLAALAALAVVLPIVLYLSIGFTFFPIVYLFLYLFW